jgi:mono/diheme cytochrome c family protein
MCYFFSKAAICTIAKTRCRIQAICHKFSHYLNISQHTSYNITRMKIAAFITSGILIVLFAASCGSSDNKETPPPFSASEVPTSSAPTGETIYKRACASCHMAGGDGIENVYPPLAKSDYIADKERAIHQVIKGSSGEIVVNGKKYNNTMPPQQLNDAEIAAVLTYVYSSFGNSGSTVTEEEVAAVRAKNP